jgi:hypothetical protein
VPVDISLRMHELIVELKKHGFCGYKSDDIVPVTDRLWSRHYAIVMRASPTDFVVDDTYAEDMCDYLRLFFASSPDDNVIVRYYPSHGEIEAYREKVKK